MIRVVLTGGAGRMGKTLARLIESDKELKLVGTVDIGDNLKDVISKCDVVVDFSSADATLNLMKIVSDAGKAMVVGTTGHTDEQRAQFEETGKKIPLLVSSNMSVGINLLWKLTEIATKAIGQEYKIDITETHHVHKKDAPSGTAKKIKEIVLKTLSSNKEIPVESIREGEVVGDHTISFGSDEERLTITHNAFTREVFAKGALKAAKWVVDREPGLYDMQDLLFE